MHESPEVNNTRDETQVWWKRKRGKQNGTRTHEEARLVHEARLLEKGLPRMLHGRDDLEGQQRLQRASRLIRIKNFMLSVSKIGFT